MVENRGRPRELGERYPSGQRRPTDFRSEGQFQRMKEAARAVGLDPMMSSQAGRLFYMDKLTARHMATIDYIAKVYARHAKHVGKEMTRRAKSPSYEPGTNRGERLNETEEQRLQAAEAKAEFDQLQELIPDFPREIRDAIERLCVDDEAIPSRWVADLAIVLTMIEECRAGTRASIRLSRGNLPLRRRTAKALTREERFESGGYAAAITVDAKPQRPSKLTGEAKEAAARDRDGLTRTLERRAAERETAA